MELYTKRRIVFASLFFIAVVFLATSLSIYFTAKPVLYRNEGVLNGDTSITSIEYSGNQMNSESSANYRLEFKISNYYLNIHIYKPDDSFTSHLLSALNTAYLDYSGEISYIIIESDTFPVTFSFKLKRINYEIDWIYGTLTVVYAIFLASMSILLGRYREGGNTLENKLKSVEQEKSMKQSMRKHLKVFRRK
ncbi:MAG: hypothetical protein KGD64_07305 [Candidatus Heimdallarchaeota archaeon]|nr:hypothetical protein [Candidatus Heimdallarchaeota archaeon]